MSSRYVAAAAAWVLGAAIATTGSIIAVSELAHGLLSQPAQQLVGTTTHPDFASRPDPSSPAASAGPAATGAAATPATSSATSPQAAAGTLLTSADGSVVASCQSGGAYLQYWSPDPGFEADDVSRGPAALATVTFEGSAGGVIMRVSCPSGTPAAQVTARPAEGDDGSESPDE